MVECLQIRSLRFHFIIIDFNLMIRYRFVTIVDSLQGHYVGRYPLSQVYLYIKCYTLSFV